jgi:hypothetical protein
MDEKLVSAIGKKPIRPSCKVGRERSGVREKLRCNFKFLHQPAAIKALLRTITVEPVAARFSRAGSWRIEPCRPEGRRYDPLHCLTSEPLGESLDHRTVRIVILQRPDKVPPETSRHARPYVKRL